MQEVNHTQVAPEECTLRSVALGTMAPPVQSILLRNTGPGPMAFRLVQEALIAFTEANHGFPVSTHCDIFSLLKEMGSFPESSF